MLGKLELNLDPASIAFEPSQSHFRQFRYCKITELRNLLIDLNAITPAQEMPREECLIRIDGDFPVDLLVRHGLIRKQ